MLTRLESCPGLPVPGEGVCFRMRDVRGRTVRFFASTGLLRRMTGRPVSDEREAFAAARSEVEGLARLVHAAWPYDDDSVIELDASHFATRPAPVPARPAMRMRAGASTPIAAAV